MTVANFLWSGLSAASGALMALILMVAGRWLPVEGFDLFSYALALGMIGEALMDMGVHQLTIREVAQDPQRRHALYQQQIGLKALTGLVMVILLQAVSAAFEPAPVAILTTGLMLTAAVARSFLLSVRGGLLGLEAFSTDSVLVVGDRLALTVTCIGALVAGVGVVGLAGTFLVTRLVWVGVAFVLARPHLGWPRWRFDPGAWAALQRRALPLGAFIMVLTTYNYVDTVMLQWLRGEDVGLYNAGYRLYEGTTYAAGVLSAVLTPRLSRLWGTSMAEHVRLARLGLVAAVGLAVVIAVPLYVWAPLWLDITFPLYSGATPVLRWLAVGLPFVFTIWILHAIAIASTQDGLLVRATATGLVINVGLNLVLIPRDGPLGAAMATVIGEGCTLIVLLVGLRRVLAGQPPLERA